MPEAPNASLLAPSAAARDTLWRAEQRVLALEQRCERDFATLFERLDGLPAMASFEPFEAMPSPRERAADEAGEAPAGEVVRKRRKAAGVTPQPITAGLLRGIGRAFSQTGSPTVGALARGVAQGVRKSAFNPEADSSVLDKLLGLPGLVTHVVTEATGAPLPQPGADVVTALTQDLMARNPAQTAAMSGFGNLNRLLTDALSGTHRVPSTTAAAMKRIGNAAAQTPLRSTAAVLQQGTRSVGQVLRAALPGVGGVLAGAVNDALQQGLAPRNGAARAPSRLLPPTNASAARTEGPAPAAPAAPAAPDVEGSGFIGSLFAAGDAAATPADEITTQLNRLLLDQAWLRGVDLR